MKSVSSFFKQCETGKDVFNAMIEAKRAGYEQKDINSAANAARARINGISVDYKKIPKQVVAVGDTLFRMVDYTVEESSPGYVRINTKEGKVFI